MNLKFKMFLKWIFLIINKHRIIEEIILKPNDINYLIEKGYLNPNKFYGYKINIIMMYSFCVLDTTQDDVLYFFDEILTKRKHYINQQDKVSGATALMHSAGCKKNLVFKKLINHPDIDIYIKDFNGNTVLDNILRVINQIKSKSGKTNFELLESFEEAYNILEAKVESDKMNQLFSKTKKRQNQL